MSDPKAMVPRRAIWRGLTTVLLAAVLATAIGVQGAAAQTPAFQPTTNPLVDAMASAWSSGVSDALAKVYDQRSIVYDRDGSILTGLPAIQEKVKELHGYDYVISRAGDASQYQTYAWAPYMSMDVSGSHRLMLVAMEIENDKIIKQWMWELPNK
jgi:hypothetical protein